MKDGIKLGILGIAAACMLCSCSWYTDSVTGYNARNFFIPYGYAESKINDTTYKVDYLCSEITPEAICDAYLYRRCAELTRDSGFNYFIVNSHSTSLQRNPHYSSGYSYTKTVADTGAYKASQNVRVPGTYIVKYEPDCIATISLYKGEKPLDNLKAFTPYDIFQYLSDQ